MLLGFLGEGEDGCGNSSHTEHRDNLQTGNRKTTHLILENRIKQDAELTQNKAQDMVLDR